MMMMMMTSMMVITISAGATAQHVTPLVNSCSSLLLRHTERHNNDEDGDGDDEINYCDNNFCRGANAQLVTLLINFFLTFPSTH